MLRGIGWFEKKKRNEEEKERKKKKKKPRWSFFAFRSCGKEKLLNIIYSCQKWGGVDFGKGVSLNVYIYWGRVAKRLILHRIV